MTLTATNGTLTLIRTIPTLAFTAGDGTADATMTFTGSIANINAALNGMFYRPTGNFNGSAELSIATNDQGNSGRTALSDTDTVAITVNAVNDAPVNAVPGPQTTPENTNLVITGLATSDVDVGASCGASHAQRDRRLAVAERHSGPDLHGRATARPIRR